MLHMNTFDPISSCSKAPRGLFVLVRTDGIFTANALSPSPLLRQCSHRYTIRAGRNLPDEEFRYLRTVIVTAAVHRGFSSNREALPLTFRHRAGVSPYTSTFVLAETCVLNKQSQELFRCGLTRHDLAKRKFLLFTRTHRTRQSLSRSYGRYLAEFLSKGSLVHLGLLDLSTCKVAVRAVSNLARVNFSRRLGSRESRPNGQSHSRFNPEGSRRLDRHTNRLLALPNRSLPAKLPPVQEY